MKTHQDPAAEVHTSSSWSWNAVPFSPRQKKIQVGGQKSRLLGIALRDLPQAATAGLKNARDVIHSLWDTDGQWVIIMAPQSQNAPRPAP